MDFARDPKFSWFHEHSKNWFHFLKKKIQEPLWQNFLGPPMWCYKGWCLIVSIPDLCPLSYFTISKMNLDCAVVGISSHIPHFWHILTFYQGPFGLTKNKAALACSTCISNSLSKSCLEIWKLFSCITQLSMYFIMLINVKMPTIVGILTFISMMNTTYEG